MKALAMFFATFALAACADAPPLETLGATQQAYSESGSALIFPATQGVDGAGHKGDMIFPALSGTWPAGQRDIVSMQPYDAGAPTMRILSQVDDNTAELGDRRLANTIVIGQNVWQYFAEGGSIMWGRDDIGPIARLLFSGGNTLWKCDQNTTGTCTLGVWDKSANGNGIPIRLSAQSLMPGTEGHGGRAELVGGARGSTSYNRGGVALIVDGWGGDDVEVEAVDVWTAHRIVAFCGGASYAASSAGSAPGDRVMHIMPAAIAPSAPPAVGAFLYVDPNDGKFKTWIADAGSPVVLTP